MHVGYSLLPLQFQAIVFAWQSPIDHNPIRLRFVRVREAKTDQCKKRTPHWTPPQPDCIHHSGVMTPELETGTIMTAKCTACIFSKLHRISWWWLSVFDIYSAVELTIQSRPIVMHTGNVHYCDLLLANCTMKLKRDCLLSNSFAFLQCSKWRMAHKKRFTGKFISTHDVIKLIWFRYGT